MADYDNVSHYVSIAQLVERWCEVPQAIGSTPIRNIDCRKAVMKYKGNTCYFFYVRQLIVSGAKGNAT